MTPQELITQIDELRVKADNSKQWKRESDEIGEEFYCSWENVGSLKVPVKIAHAFWQEEELNFAKGTADYIHVLHNAYKDLRKYVLERDMYKKAGEKLAEAVERIDVYDSPTRDLASTLANRKNEAWRRFRDEAVSAYRSAIKDSQT